MATYPFPGRIRPRPEIRPPRCPPPGAAGSEPLDLRLPAGEREGAAEKEAPGMLPVPQGIPGDTDGADPTAPGVADQGSMDPQTFARRLAG